MPLSLTQSKTALVANMQASFLGIGGTPPYAYAIVTPPNGPGGTVDPGTGVYQAPGSVAGKVTDPALRYDVVQVTDSLAAQVTARILVGTPLLLLREILQSELSLADDHCFFWDQKVFQPTDLNMYLSISVDRFKPYANRVVPSGAGGGWDQVDQIANMQATISLNLMSKSEEAMMRAEEVLLALKSQYSEFQQEANAFKLAEIPEGWVNVSLVDGAAIPYRFASTFKMLYAVRRTKAVPYFNVFQDVAVTTN